MQSFIEIEQLFKNSDIKRIKVEDNFFNIGTRKFYENPFTEVLGYILDSETQFKGRKQFIEKLLENVISESALQSLIEFGKTSTQFSTSKGKVIDLVFWNKNSIVVFENKIFHVANNPFEDYTNHITQKYPNHDKFFVLLSYKNEFPPVDWHYVSIQHTFKAILEVSKFDFTSKWDFFINDFLTHYSNNKIRMTDNEKDFYENNFAKIIAANNNLQQYLINIANSFVEDNDLKRFEIATKWNGETKAIRFYPFDDKSNVVLTFETDGRFKISIYYYKDYHSFIGNIYQRVGRELYNEWREGSICCFQLTNSYRLLQEALAECKRQIEQMRNYYGQLVDEE